MTAEEVLKEMEADWERFLQTDSMKRLIIDPDSRRIIGPKGGILLGVENDKEVERKYFECPKIVGNGIDISDREYQLRINYRNARGDEDTYLVDDVEVSGNNITFSWELWRKVTLYKGEVKFILCVVRPDGDLIDSEWNTTLATGIVLEGLEVENPEPTPEEKDVVAQLINMMQTESSKAVEAVKAEGELQVENVKKAGAIETEKAAGAVRELTDATDSAERKRAELENVIEEANAAKENGVKVKESLDESIEGAVGIKESLDSAREEAETGHDRLNQKIVDAEAENGEIAESIRLAGVAKENLSVAISDAGIAYKNLGNKIEESNTAGNELVEKTQEADSVKSSLEKNISYAGLAEDSLRKGINAAQTTTEDLLAKKAEAVKAIEDTAKEEKEGIAAAVTQYIEENQLKDGESAYEIAVQSGFVGTKEEWLESLKGETGPQGPKGETGEAGPQGPQGETGYTPQKGIDYSDGKNGSDGISPHIGDNGNWFVGDVDTGVKAAGRDGSDAVVKVDTVLSTNSSNAVENSVIAKEFIALAAFKNIGLASDASELDENVDFTKIVPTISVCGEMLENWSSNFEPKGTFEVLNSIVNKLSLDVLNKADKSGWAKDMYIGTDSNGDLIEKQPPSDGYTPIKGTDYFTDADKQEIVTAVINSLPKYNGEVIE